jgi:hypothetical protein
VFSALPSPCAGPQPLASQPVHAPCTRWAPCSTKSRRGAPRAGGLPAEPPCKPCRAAQALAAHAPRLRAWGWRWRAGAAAGGAAQLTHAACLLGVALGATDLQARRPARTTGSHAAVLCVSACKQEPAAWKRAGAAAG